jgi:hypothetical protein
MLIERRQTVRPMTQKKRTTMFKGRYLCGWVMLFTATSGCGSRQSTPLARPVSARDLIRNSAFFAGRVTTVDGCLDATVEGAMLGPCTGAWTGSPDLPVRSRINPWDASERDIHYPVGLHPPEPQRLSPDEKRIEADLFSRRLGTVSKVVLEGEYRRFTDSEFRQFPEWKYEFVIHRVISAMPYSR